MFFAFFALFRRKKEKRADKARFSRMSASQKAMPKHRFFLSLFAESFVDVVYRIGNCREQRRVHLVNGIASHLLRDGIYRFRKAARYRRYRVAVAADGYGKRDRLHP